MASQIIDKERGTETWKWAMQAKDWKLPDMTRAA